MSLRVRVSIGIDSMTDSPMIHEARTVTVPRSYAISDEDEHLTQMLEELGHIGPEIEKVVAATLNEVLADLGRFRADMESKNR
jgi:hypothetical protein